MAAVSAQTRTALSNRSGNDLNRVPIRATVPPLPPGGLRLKAESGPYARPMTCLPIAPNLRVIEEPNTHMKDKDMTSSKQQSIRTLRRLLPGGTLAVIGSLLALGGGGLLAAFGTDGSLASGPHLLSTPTSAIVSPVASIKHTSGVASVIGQPTLRFSAAPVQGTAGVFVGVGRAADVDRYLAGVATEQVTNLNVDPYSITGTSHSGRLNAAPPTTQRFWVAHGARPARRQWSTGRSATANTESWS